MSKPTFIPGIDESLPPGETLLWSGKPTVAGQLRRGLLLRIAGVWLLVAAAVPILQPGTVEGSVAAHVAWVGVVGLLVLGMAAGFAWLVRRTTVYAVTNRRVVMRIGIALPSVLNIPLEELAGASCRSHGDGSGDIYLPLAHKSDVGWPLLWPHVRPWRVTRATPALRWLEDVEQVSGLLTEAALSHGRFEAAEEAPRRRTERRPSLEKQVAGV
jgi:hypothetical protein